MEQENDKQKTSVFFDEELEMMPSCIYLYPDFLDEIDPPIETKIGFSKEAFDPSKVLCGTKYD